MTIPEFLVAEADERNPNYDHVYAGFKASFVNRFREYTKNCQAVGIAEDGEPVYTPEDLEACSERYEEEWLAVDVEDE